jgi:hypothetical protein
MSMSKIRGAGFAVVAGVVAALAIVFAFAVSAPASAQVVDPPPGRVSDVRTFVLLAPTATTQGVAASTWYTSASPLDDAGTADASLIERWQAVDLFITADVSGTTYFTLTPQFSADQVNWANGTARVISGTTPSNVSYTITGSADGTSYLRMPLYGRWMRVLLQVSGATVNTEVRAVLRRYE